MTSPVPQFLKYVTLGLLSQTSAPYDNRSLVGSSWLTKIPQTTSEQPATTTTISTSGKIPTKIQS